MEMQFIDVWCLVRLLRRSPVARRAELHHPVGLDRPGELTVGNGFVTVTLSNDLTNPKSAGQLLSGLGFTLSSGQTPGSLGPTSANLRHVDKGGSFTDLGPSATGWALDDTFPNGFLLCVLCNNLGGSGPSHLLIGGSATTGTYVSANGSIAGNKPHNPLTSGTATFLINAPGRLVQLDGGSLGPA
jgi:hypothetical protein